MPTKRKDRSNAWLARVVLEGRQVASLQFPPGRKKGPEWTAAKQWEVDTKKHIQESLAQGNTLFQALDKLGLNPGPQLAAELRKESPNRPIPMGLEKLLAWGDSYLEEVRQSMSQSTYDEKKSHMEAFFAFCREQGITGLADITKPVAYKFLAGIRAAKQQEAAARLAARARPEDETPTMETDAPKFKGKIGNPASVANKYRKNLLAAWNWGIDFVEGFPQGKSPIAMVKEFPVEETERYVPPEEDVVKVLELAKGQDLVMLLVFYYTGARAGEVFRLSWTRDIRLETGKIRLQDRKTKDGKPRVRWNDMHPELVNALAWWQEARPCRVDNVFMQTHCAGALGLPFRHRSKFCARLCRRAGVKPFVFYSIRHVSAHLAFRDGGISAAKSLLGHYHATTTDDYLRKMGLYTDQCAIQASLSKSGIGLAGADLMEHLVAEGSLRHERLQEDKKMPREVRTHEAFCNRELVTDRLQ